MTSVSTKDGGVLEGETRGGARDRWVTRGTELISLRVAVWNGIFRGNFDSGFDFGVSKNYDVGIHNHITNTYSTLKHNTLHQPV